MCCSATIAVYLHTYCNTWYSFNFHVQLLDISSTFSKTLIAPFPTNRVNISDDNQRSVRSIAVQPSFRKHGRILRLPKQQQHIYWSQLARPAIYTSIIRFLAADNSHSSCICCVAIWRHRRPLNPVFCRSSAVNYLTELRSRSRNPGTITTVIP